MTRCGDDRQANVPGCGDPALRPEAAMRHNLALHSTDAGIFSGFVLF